MRINFARNAPSGNAFVEVFRGKKKIGTARARVRRGGSRQVSVKLTKAGRKLLRNSERKRMQGEGSSPREAPGPGLQDGSRSASSPAGVDGCTG